jgi:hypothetical protein
MLIAFPYLAFCMHAAGIRISVADPDPRIRCFFDPCIRDGKNPDLGSGIRYKQPKSYFRVQFLELKILKFFVAYRYPDPESSAFLTLDPGVHLSDKIQLIRCLFAGIPINFFNVKLK